MVKPNVLRPALEKSLRHSEGQTASSIFEGVWRPFIEYVKNSDLLGNQTED